MSGAPDFHYRLPGSVGGLRPGAHAGRSLGTGLAFAAHRRLLDHPDPRRLDLRASLRDPRGDWLVRIQRQRAAVPVQVVVDVSASMAFGAARPKLNVVADFVEALGRSAFRSGDALGLRAHDHAPRDDLFQPPRHSRGAGLLLADALRRCADAPASGTASTAPPTSPRQTADALAQTLAPLAGRDGLVFVVSDFHWPLDTLGAALARLAPACVVPIVVWDRAETEPPDGRALLAVRDAETGERRTLWLAEPLRRRWRDAVTERRETLHALFAALGLAPFHLGERFDAEALTRHFLERVA
ncbi:DUF58 domain-containing protein [Leptothrix sp. BB-4]